MPEISRNGRFKTKSIRTAAESLSFGGLLLRLPDDFSGCAAGAEAALSLWPPSELIDSIFHRRSPHASAFELPERRAKKGLARSQALFRISAALRTGFAGCGWRGAILLTDAGRRTASNQDGCASAASSSKKPFRKFCSGFSAGSSCLPTSRTQSSMARTISARA